MFQQRKLTSVWLLPAAEAAAQFSNIMFDLLMEYGVVHCTQPHGRHRPRRIETTLRNLAVMKNDSHKFMQRDNGNFLTLVRSHNRVLRCYHCQVNNRETCRQERDFRKNPWKYLNKRLQLSNNPDPSFTCDVAISHFTETYSDDTVTYNGHLPDWASESIRDCDPTLFNVESITPSLVKRTPRQCSMQSAPGMDGITYYHLSRLPSSQHFMATLFNKILQAESAPACWGLARIKLIFKAGSPDDPSNYQPIALTSVVGKLFHKILSHRLEMYLRSNGVIDTSVQKGFVSGLPGVFEHIYSLSAIMQDAKTNKSPLMMTFLDLKNAFGSMSHQLIFDMLNEVVVSCRVHARAPSCRASE